MKITPGIGYGANGSRPSEWLSPRCYRAARGAVMPPIIRNGVL